MKLDLQGIIPAIVTPYGAGHTIDSEVTRKLVDALIGQGVGGLYVGGTTGEGPMQSPAERTEFTALVADVVGGRVPVVAHVGAADTAGSIEMARNAANAGANAVSAVAPFYYQHGREQVRQHFLDIAEASPVPFLPYHLPMAGGDDATFHLFIELAAHENIVGFKYTSRDIYELQQLVALCGDGAAIFNGADEVCIHGLLAGAAGAIGSTYNFMAGLFVQAAEALAAGDAPKAARLQGQANGVIRQGAHYDNVAFARAVLQAQGFDVGPPRKPIQQMSADDHALVARLVAETPFL
ncbi:dihydrodipicolinate synthase family protein [Phytoactinopolyspora alkaliphila]|uniref:Dihydrodipicolinate synthase family protein n=1 Tax=Phytoactinopolyspora alkaliphila TaxID=1783498 RepID=A0A6N9YIJ2_9ACTN|nr:dihydrodipicolinate synthase family protein [Phytoactinopolyspora alkaliphila]